MSDDSIEPGIDDQLIGDFLVERATINPASIIQTRINAVLKAFKDASV